MIALGIASLGLLAIAAAAVVLRAVGPGFRIARLLAAAPEVSLAEAVSMAAAGERRYVRVSGRISSEEEFPDEHDRPLVYRRSRLEVADRSGRWRVLSEDREAVPFGLELRADFVAVDGAALDDGLVVIQREATGRAADLPGDTGTGLDPDTPARLLVEQVSAVEHAIAAGVPARGPDGQPVLGAGLGRPLILTTLDMPAAMRILARDRRRHVIVAAVLVICGLALLAAALVVGLAAGLR